LVPETAAAAPHLAHNMAQQQLAQQAVGQVVLLAQPAQV
jgi:hypothetical protein